MEAADRLHSGASLVDGAAQLSKQAQPTTPLRKAGLHMSIGSRTLEFGNSNELLLGVIWLRGKYV